MKTTSLVPLFEIYGRDEEGKMVVEKICSKDIIRDDVEGFQVYVIRSMGSGKDYSCKFVYNYERMKTQFELQS